MIVVPLMDAIAFFIVSILIVSVVGAVAAVISALREV